MIGTLIAAWLDVRSKPVRTLAAILGMITAITAVIIVDASGELSRRANEQYVVRSYGRTATIRIAPSEGAVSMTRPPDSSPTGNDGSSQSESTARIQDVLAGNAVHMVTRNAELSLVVMRDGEGIPTEPLWVSSTYPAVSLIDLVAGSFPTETAQSTTLHAVISVDFAHTLGFLGPDAVGQAITASWMQVGGRELWQAPTFLIVIDAVAETIGPSRASAPMLIVSDLDTLPGLSKSGDSWLVAVRPRDISDVDEMVSRVLDTTTGRPAYATVRVDAAETFAPLLDQQAVTARAITWVALAIGGFGILGIGLASVRERAKDYGLRRALGASTTKVSFGVVAQTLIESLFAGSIAVLIGAVVIKMLARRLVLAELPLPSPVNLPIESAIRGVAAAALIGLVASLLPAFRAARASIVQALRD
jgi:putative ABC transport system permease protein